jgi:hypothetical protein
VRLAISNARAAIRGEHILLEPLLHLGRGRQRAFQQRRRNRDDFQTPSAHHGDGAVEFLVRQIDDVLAGDHPQLGALQSGL